MSSIDAGSINSSVRIDVKSLQQDVAKVEKVYDDLEADIRKSTKDVEKAINNVSKVQQQGALSQEQAIQRIIDIRKKEIERLKNNVTEKGKASNAELTQIRKNEIEIRNLERAQSSYNDELKEGTSLTEDNTSSLAEQALAFGAVTLAVTTAKNAISIFAETEQELANVKAVSNATAEEFEKLEEAALSAGETTRFTAQEAAEALFSLSSAGLDATQSISALDGVLTLAGATGSDLDFTARTVTATLSQFRLESEKSADVANVFAAANSNSQATLEKLNNALRQAGPIAGQFNISLEETVASLQALFDAGFQGEQSGTALRNILLTLADSSSDVAEAFINAGGSFEDIDTRTVGLTQAFENLVSRGIDLSEVFDKEAVGAALTLGSAVQDTDRNLRSLEEAVTGTNEAARQYEVQNDTLSGSLDRLKSAGEGLAISTGDTLSPVLRFLADTLSNLTNLASGLPGPLQAAGTGAGVASVGFLALSKALAAIGITLTGPIGIIAGIGGLIVLLANLKGKADERAAQRLAEDFGELSDSLGVTSDEFDEFLKKSDQVQGALSKFGSDFDIDNINSAVERLAFNLDLSEKEVVSIGLESKIVTDELKAQLTTMRNQIIQQEDLNSLLLQQVSIEEAIELSKANQERIAAREKAEADLLAQAEKERLARLENIQKEVETLDELSRKGAISERELLEEKKSLRQEEIALLIEQSRTSGEVSLSVVEDIARQQVAIDRYDARLEELNTDEEERQDRQTRIVERENKRRTDSYQTYLDTVYGKQVESNELFISNQKLLTDDLTENWQSYFSTVLSLVSSFVESSANAARVAADREIDEINRTLEADISAIDERTNSRLESLGLLEETIVESLQRRITEAEEAGDTETANLLQDELDRTLILDEATAEKLKLEEEAAKKTAQLEYEANLAQWRASKAATIFTGAQAAITAYNSLAGIPVVGPGLGLAAAAFVAGLTAKNVSTIDQAKPQPPNFQTGGVVLPSPGGTVINTAENGSPEFVANLGPEGEGVVDLLASRLNSKSAPTTIILEVDSRILAETVVGPINKGQVRVKLR